MYSPGQKIKQIPFSMYSPEEKSQKEQNLESKSIKASPLKINADALQSILDDALEIVSPTDTLRTSVDFEMSSPEGSPEVE
tara:strand:+ start:728 stop:970 length:243 start_codon:yes stop_codon:yes gene_type:complete